MLKLFRSLMVLALTASCAAAQTPPPPDGASIRLYDGPAPGSPPAAAHPERVDVRDGMRVVRNVSDPSLTVFLPEAGKATGAAVVVAPGGGFLMLSYDSEGTLAARWLAEHGVAAFVLKYRVEQTPAEPIAFMPMLMSRMAKARPADGATMPAPFPTEAWAAADAAAAVQLVRRRAAEWGVDPHRVGFLGFSAGAITATNIATTGRAADRPDFIGVIYGGLRNTVPSDAPPAFFATASDDPLLAKAAVPMLEAWQAAKRPAELHLYERGGHGFGMKPQGASSDHWMDEFFWWLQSRGLVKTGSAR